MDLIENAKNSLVRYRKCFTPGENTHLSTDEKYLNLIEVETGEVYSKLVTNPKTQILYSFQVHESSANFQGQFHGGSNATLAELCTNCTATAFDINKRIDIISIEAQFCYHIAIEFNIKIFLLTEVEKASKRFSSIRYAIYDDKLRLAASGRFTKAFQAQKL